MVCILSGEIIARRILKGLKKKKTRKKLSLVVVQIGKNKVSSKYVEEKRKVAKGLKVGFRFIIFPASVSQAKLEKQVKKIGKDPKVSGMIVQLPLPKRMNTQRVLDNIPIDKDVDVLSSASFWSL